MHIELSKPDAQSLEAARALYLESFPPEERRPWSSIEHRDDERGPWLKIISVDDRFAGFLTVWHFGGFNYIEHLATHPSVRGGGIGSLVLQSLKTDFPEPWVLEVEPESDSDPMPARRIGFYTRAGFSIIDRTYVQPPYSPELPEVPMYIMASGDADPAEVTRTLHRHVYKAGS